MKQARNGFRIWRKGLVAGRLRRTAFLDMENPTVARYHRDIDKEEW